MENMISGNLIKTQLMAKKKEKENKAQNTVKVVIFPRVIFRASAIFDIFVCF